jgi:hypothetical protein
MPAELFEDSFSRLAARSCVHTFLRVPYTIRVIWRILDLYHSCVFCAEQWLSLLVCMCPYFSERGDRAVLQQGGIIW